MAKIAIGAASACNPASTTSAQPPIDTVKPARPSSNIGLRPCLSERRAQTGEVNAQASAEREKVQAISASGIASARPIAGITDTSPRLPTAVISVTANSKA